MSPSFLSKISDTLRGILHRCFCWGDDGSKLENKSDSCGQNAPSGLSTAVEGTELQPERNMEHQAHSSKENGLQPSASAVVNSTSSDVDIKIVADNFAVERKLWVDSIKEQVFSWHFNIFDLNQTTNGNPLITTTVTLLEVYELLDGWKLNRKTVETFLLRVESGYEPNSYHNRIHASDVTQTACIIMKSFSKHVTEVTKMDMFCIIMASAVHDLGHLGVNNDFLINSKHPRATTYNDRSVNENFHISRAFEIARNYSGCDIFEAFTFDEQKKCRKLMIDTVMATDMAIHFDLLKNFNSQIEAKPLVNDWEDRNLLYQMVVHLADIANPSRPFHLARGWAERVIVEFCEQGDKEAELGLAVSPFCNRKNMNMPRAQINFIEIFLKPTLASFQKAAPEFVSMAQEYLEKTIAEWKALEAQGFKM
eukprot:gene32708-3592_t